MNRKNIVELVRARPSFVDRDEEALQKLGLLGYELVNTLETRLGKWDFYTRENYVLPYFLEPDEEHKEPSSDFVAIYYREEKPVNLFNGKLEDLDIVKKDALIFSRNILEQRAPLRWFYKNTGVGIGFIGTMASLLGFIFTTLYWYLPDLNQPVPPSTFNSLIKGAGASITSSWFVGVPVARLADRLRLRGVSESAESYDYAYWTMSNLRGELYELERETEKEKMYRRFLEDGLGMTRDGFMWLYERRGVNRNRLLKIYQEWVEMAESIGKLKEMVNPETIDRIVGIFEEFREN